MEAIPDDILHLVFDAYVHQLGCSPASLLTICRHWNAILVSTRALWSRVTIHITSFETIPFLIGDTTNVNEMVEPVNMESGPLSLYLDRSFNPDSPLTIPLDIILVFHHFDEDSDGSSGFRRLRVWETRKKLKDQLCGLLLHLAGLKYTNPFKNTDIQKITKEFKYRYMRWRSIYFDGQGWNPKLPPISASFKPLKLQGCSNLPSIRHISAKGVDINLGRLYMPLLMAVNAKECSLFSFPKQCSFSKLSLLNDVGRFSISNHIPWQRLSGLDTLEATKVSLEYSRFFTAGFSFNLSTVLFEDSISYNILNFIFRFYCQEKPLKRLGLSQTDPEDILFVLDTVGDHLFLTLALSARHFISRPRNLALWEWDTYGMATWPIPEEDIAFMRLILKDLKPRGIQIEAMDAQIQAILDAVNEG